jgi:hypothetical protein
VAWAPLNPIAAAVQQTMEKLTASPATSRPAACASSLHAQHSAEQVLEITQRALRRPQVA